jgi:flagellar hook protein FlgE
VSGGGGSGAGIGVTVATVSQQFSQGNINITGNNLDVAINGGGFFQLTQPDGTPAYTRDGSFKLDKVGNIVTNGGANVMGYPTDITGKATSSSLQSLQMPTAAPIAAKGTTSMVAELNLNASSPIATGRAGIPADPTTTPPTAAVAAVPATPLTTFGTSLTAYDTQGVGLPVSMYFSKVDPLATGFVSPATATAGAAVALAAGQTATAKAATTAALALTNSAVTATAAAAAATAAGAPTAAADTAAAAAATTAAAAATTAALGPAAAAATATAAAAALMAANPVATNQWAVYDSSSPITSAPGVWPSTPAAVGILEFDATGKLMTSYAVSNPVKAGSDVAVAAAAVVTAEAADTAASTPATVSALASAIAAAVAAIKAAQIPFASDATASGAITTFLALPTPTGADIATAATAIATATTLAAATTAYANTTVPGEVPFTLKPNPDTSIVPAFNVTVDMGKITQYGAAFAVSNLTQDGYASGELTGLNIAESGVIIAKYSNGQTQAAGQLSLADFRNVQGLSPLGGNAWSATFESGQAVRGEPGIGKFGALRSGALEESNVDLTAELVNMMTAQRAYQANAQTIKTQDQVMSTLVNLR